MVSLKDQIKILAEKIFEDVVQFRRHIHIHPELSFREYNTSAYIKSILVQWGIEWEPMAETGIVAIVKGDGVSERIIALRADIDALPIHEKNDSIYKSRNEGVMHACGHDAHTASLLGVINILNSLKASFSGTVKFIFQPAEEKLPGGASIMIKEGVLDNPIPEAIIGQHVFPPLPCGKVGFRKGKHMASMDELNVTVFGKGGHGAQPHQNIDPVLIMSHIIIGLQQVVSRSANPTMPTVLSFGKLVADGAFNIIPDSVYAEGTFRTLDEEWRTEAHQLMKKMAEGIAESMNGRCEFNIIKGYPFLLNEEKLTGRLIEYAADYAGEENIVNLDIWMAAEDFSYYSQATDACFYMLGIRNEEKNITSSLHTATFDIDENALRLSIGLMSYLALRELGN
jgi:amidohydrolase